MEFKLLTLSILLIVLKILRIASLFYCGFIAPIFIFRYYKKKPVSASEFIYILCPIFLMLISEEKVTPKGKEIIKNYIISFSAALFALLMMMYARPIYLELKSDWDRENKIYRSVASLPEEKPKIVKVKMNFDDWGSSR